MGKIRNTSELRETNLSANFRNDSSMISVSLKPNKTLKNINSLNESVKEKTEDDHQIALYQENEDLL